MPLLRDVGQMRGRRRLLFHFLRFLPAGGSHLGPCGDPGKVGHGQSHQMEELDPWTTRAIRWTDHLRMLTYLVEANVPFGFSSELTRNYATKPSQQVSMQYCGFTLTTPVIHLQDSGEAARGSTGRRQ